VAAIATVLRQGVEHLVEHPSADPGLIAAMAGLVRGIAPRQILPGSAGLEDPEDPIQHITGVAPGTPAPIRPAARPGQQRFEHGPLFVGEVHESAPGPRALEYSRGATQPFMG
jgi:hypothetical protein